MVTGSRLRQIGWLVALGICVAAFLALTFKVNSIKSEVRLAERQIVKLERDKLLFETEFQTLANQQQLADWNKIDFGYQAPTAGQYLENERQLASLGQPRGLNAPQPIRVARAEAAAEDIGFPAMLSPLTGKPVDENRADDGQPADRPVRSQNKTAPLPSLAERLSAGTDLTGYMSGSAE